MVIDYKADLHLHSEESDGSLPPAQVVEMAYSAGLNLISLTDHDTVSGVEEAVKRGRELGVTVLPGVEFSAYDKEEVHILGYNVPYLDEKFLKEIENTSNMRYERHLLTIGKLNGLGVKITMAEVENEAKGDVVGRFHIAKVMVKKGCCKDVSEAFEKFLAAGQKAFVFERTRTPSEAVKLVNDFGAVAVLAHPHRLCRPFCEIQSLVFELKQAGLKGIENGYFSQTSAEKERFRTLAEKYSLVKTGGSDFHDTLYRKLGEYFVPDRAALKVLGLVKN